MRSFASRLCHFSVQWVATIFLCGLLAMALSGLAFGGEIHNAAGAGDLEAVAAHGHIVIFGGASGPADPISPNDLMTRSFSLSGGSLPNFILTREELTRRANDVIEGIRQGLEDMKAGRTMSLEDFKERARKKHGISV